MFETIITVLIVGAAAFWFFRWFRGAASGKTGCSCSGCGGKCSSASELAENAPCCPGQGEK